MFEINQDALCDYCERTFGTDRSRCEGNRCDSARSDYISDHDLEEIEKKRFFDLRVGDPIYIIHDGEILTQKITGKYENEEKLSISTNKLSGLVVEGNSSSEEKRCVYIYKDDAIASYRKLMDTTMQKMIDHLIEFSK